MGQVWVANTNSTLSIFTNYSAALSPGTGLQPGGLTAPSAIAIDQTGSVWIANAGSSTITRILGVAAPVVSPMVNGVTNGTTATFNYSAGSMAGPSSLAIDGSDNVWIANRTGNSVSELAHAGVPVAGISYTGSMNAPSSIALDQNGYVWVANSGSNSLVFFGNGLRVPPQVVTGGGLNGPSALAFDAKDNSWVALSGSRSSAASSEWISTWWLSHSKSAGEL